MAPLLLEFAYLHPAVFADLSIEAHEKGLIPEVAV